jgi:diguanylate cyclase (GGDEF)-like protein
MTEMFIDVDDARARLGRLSQLIEAKEYYAVGASRRFRAVQRRRTWGATRAGMLVVTAAALILVVIMSLLHPGDVGFFLALDGALGFVGVAAWWALTHRLRKQPEFVAFAVGLAVLFGVMELALGGPRLIELAMAYLMFLPTVVALVIPWRTWTEVRWLATYAALGTLFIALVPEPSLDVSRRSDLIVGMVSALIASFTGHVLLFRHHVRTFSQMQALAGLHRRENSQRVELERVYRSLEITARTDELTRVGNRMKFDEDLVAVRARMGRTSQPVGLLEIDLDHFKAVNDRLGHLAGDKVLRVVARAIRDAVRADDQVYRYGGEEFVVILGSINGGVRAAAERVRVAVEDLGLAHPDNPPFGLVTVSVGAVALRQEDLAQTADGWFDRVDAALYEAKAVGRNRVAVAGGHPPGSAPLNRQPPARRLAA